MQKQNIKKPLQVPELQGVFRAGSLAPDDKFNVNTEKWIFLHKKVPMIGCFVKMMILNKMATGTPRNNSTTLSTSSGLSTWKGFRFLRIM